MAAEGLSIAMILEAKNLASEQINRVSETLERLGEITEGTGESVDSSFMTMEDAMSRFLGVSSDDVDFFERMAAAAGVSDEALASYTETLRSATIDAATTAAADEQAAAIERVGTAAGISAEDLAAMTAAAREAAAAETEAGLSADTESAEMDTATASTDAASGSLSKFGMMGAAALAGVGLVSVKLASTFQESTASLQAHANMSAKAANDIGTAFLNTAGSTTFSASQMMEAFAPVSGEFEQMYGKALTTAQTLQVMRASMDMSEASGESLTSTTKTLADTLQVFQLNTSQAAAASDDLWNTSRRLGVGIGTLSQSINRLKPRIIGSGMSLQQLSGFMLELAKTAGTGRQAMRVAGQTIQSLEDPSMAAQKALNQVGISLTNSQGKFIGMNAAMHDLNGVLAKIPGGQNALSASTKLLAVNTQLATDKAQLNQTALAGTEASLEQQKAALTAQTEVVTRDSLMTALFGRNTQAVLPILAGGTQELNKNANAAGKLGTAQSAAKTMASTFEGQLKTLKSTAEDLLTTIGTALIPVITQLAHRIVTAIKPLVEWIDHNKKAATTILEVVGAVAGLLTAMSLAHKASTVVSNGFKDAGLVFKNAGKAISGMWSAMKWVAGKLLSMFGAQETANTTLAASEDAVGASGDVGAEGMEAMTAAADASGIGEIVLAIGLLIALIVALVIGIVELVKHWKTVWHAMEVAAKAVFDFLKEFVPIAMHDIVEFVEAAVHDVVGFFEVAPGKIVGFFTRLPGEIGAFFTTIGHDAEHVVDDIVTFFEGLPRKILGFLDALPGDFLALGKKLVTQLLDGLKDIGSKVGSLLTGVLSKIPIIGGLFGHSAPKLSASAMKSVTNELSATVKQGATTTAPTSTSSATHYHIEHMTVMANNPAELQQQIAQRARVSSLSKNTMHGSNLATAS